MARSTVKAALAVLALAVLPRCSCGDNQPCTSNCPQITGSYALTFDDSSGTPTACAALGVRDPQGPLAVSQQGSTLQATLANIAMAGTLFDTWDLTLDGTLPSDAGPAGSASIRARYIPPIGDAGASLQGTYTAQQQGSGNSPPSCVLQHPFTGAKQ